jgi:mono/diheme cytochrome c family protein
MVSEIIKNLAMIRARSILMLNPLTMSLVSFRSFPPENPRRTCGPTHGWPRWQCHLIMSSQPSIAAWHAMAFNPQSGLVYIPTQVLPTQYTADPHFKPHPIGWNLATGAEFGDEVKGYLLAWDPVGQKEVWRANYLGPWNGGVLTTAGNLVAQGTAAGDFRIYRADNGEKLWSMYVQSGIIAPPVYCSVCHGQSAVSGGITPDLRHSSFLANDVWYQIVLNGILQDAGMASFGKVLDQSSATAIRAYLIHEANQSPQSPAAHSVALQGRTTSR